MLVGLAVASDTAAANKGGSRGGRSGGHSASPGGSHGGSHSGSRASGRSGNSGTKGSQHYRHHHHSGVGYAFLGAAALYPWPFSYDLPPAFYFGPDFLQAHQAVVPVYVEQFLGMPTPDMQGEVFCPNRGAYYPDVLDCPGGWQRVFYPWGAPD